MADETHYSLPCDFCTASFSVPVEMPKERAWAWVWANHFPSHIEEMADDHGHVPTCARCQRYRSSDVGPRDPLHRKCFETACYCPCSRMKVAARAD